MAKMFYTAKEAAEKLGRSEIDLKDLVREGKLREFRDAGTVNYKVGDVDGLVGKMPAKGPAKAPAPQVAAAAASSRSASGEIVLEPIDDSGIELAPSRSDVIKLETADAEETATGVRLQKKKKEGSSVPSVGLNVFDDDELDEHVDPLAQTAVSDVAGLGLEGTGSGSGILDLTRESDDTSLGAELLDEIYTGEEESGGTVEMGDATRAGLDEAIPADAPQEAHAEPVLAATAVTPAAKPARGAVTKVILEYGPDPVATALSAVMVAAIAVMLVGGLGGAALLQKSVPGLLKTIYANLMIFSLASLVICGLAGAITYFVAKKQAG
ncbi:MAG: helix-turn-helix domain-containing protein [Planctomycetes bacterium]|nr:helix-turn-helix domain-containing protein [Planctomycetota bacterium]MBI3833328.1 helix-turn-helix domain-containing protein [Planctomycetota bacterium]